MAVNSLWINLRQRGRLLLELYHALLRGYQCTAEGIQQITVRIKMLGFCPFFLYKPVIILFCNTEYLLYCSEVDFYRSVMC
jgi:hypothetical protein